MKLYTVQFYSDILKWHNKIGAMLVNKSFALGFCSGVKLFYPCPKMRIIDNENNVIKEYNSNGNVDVC
jgi:hypothetical protein